MATQTPIGTPVFKTVGGDVSAATVTYTPSGSTAAQTETIEGVASSLDSVAASVTSLSSDVSTYNAANTKKWGQTAFFVTDYGASGSSSSTTGAISAGSNTLTVADASDFSVGQGISIAGAGDTTSGSVSNTGYFVSTISDISGNVITLAGEAAVGVSGAVVQHDDRDAIQSAIQAAFDQGGGVVYFPSGVYNLAGPFFSDSYSLLKIPNNQDDSEPVSITLRGEINGSSAYAEMYTGAIPQKGVVINGLANTSANMWALLNGASGGLLWSLVTVNVETMTFRLPYTANGPTYNGLFFGDTANANLTNVTVDTNIEGSELPEPTNTSGVGIVLPPVDNYGNISCRNVYVTGYYIGISHSEHAILDGVFIQQCANALEVEAGYHNAVYLRVLIQECPNLIWASGELPVYGVMDVETFSLDNNKWWTQKTLTTGTGNVTGKIIYSSVAAGVGYSDLTSFSNSCARLKFENERGVQQPATAITPSASPYAYTAPQSGALVVSGGTVTALTITRSGTVIDTGMTNGIIPVGASDTVSVTYSTAPAMTFLP